MAYTINLTHRGPQVIQCIDLFDEARYGADNLFFRGRFQTTTEVKEQIEAALNSAQKDYGGGNPLAQMTTDADGNITSPTISLNRWHIPNKKFWNNTPPMDVINPYKASNAVTFYIRVHFHDDFGYITFGCPWSEIQDSLDETETSSSITDTAVLISKFKFINCHFISKEDSIQILKSLGLKVNEWDGRLKSTTQTQDEQEESASVLNIMDEDGTHIEI